MGLISILIILAIILLVIELLLIPGFGFAGVGALLAFAAAIIYAYTQYNSTIGNIVVFIVVVLSASAILFALKTDTWKRVALKTTIDSRVEEPDMEQIKEGDRGRTVTRLAPMGKVLIGDQMYEAKSIDAYIDPNKEVMVIGFDNMNILVRSIT